MKKILKIEVVKISGEWLVKFHIGHQSFILKYGGTKTKANWMRKMLIKAFNNLESYGKN